ncbi:cysteine desulfurase family protein [candidate division KSB1 bacterium]
MNNVYLDYGATTPVDKRALESMQSFFRDHYGNASSIHSFGRDAKNALERARERIAQMIRSMPDEIYFTCGGTEADNWALKGYAYANKDKGRHIVTSVVEHHAILHTCHVLEEEGFEITYLPVDGDGIIDPDDLKNVLRKETLLVSLMHVNNETGVINDIGALGRIIREHGAVFHTDAVQSFGKLPIDVNRMNVDLLSVSSHKLYGPKGAGSLYIRDGLKMSSLLVGGSHEHGGRAGTENIPAIVGFGAAAHLCRKNMGKEQEAQKKLRDHFWDRISNEIGDCRMNGHHELRTANNLNVSFVGADGESILLSLDLRGIAASAGSACTAGGIELSHVIKALDLPPEYKDSAIRFTLGRYTTRSEIDYTVDVLKEIVERIRSL